MGNPFSLNHEKKQSLLFRNQGAPGQQMPQPATFFTPAPGEELVLWGKVAPPVYWELDGPRGVLGNSQNKNWVNFTTGPG